jgi:hypothetical protein
VDVNSVIDYEIVYKGKKSVFDDDYFGNYNGVTLYYSYDPVLTKTLRITFPKKYEKYFYFKNINAKHLKISKQEKNGRIIFTVTRKNIKNKYEVKRPPLKTFAERIYWGFHVHDLNHDLKYVRAKAEKALKNSKLLKPTAEKITKGLDGYEKLKAVYSFVANQIQNVFVPFNDADFYPSDYDRILKLKRANSLDKMFLFENMLKAVGIKCKIAYFADKNYTFDEDGYINIDMYANLAVEARLGNKKYYLAPMSTTSRMCDLIFSNSVGVWLESGKTFYKPYNKAEKYAVSENMEGVLDNDGNLTLEAKYEFKGGKDYTYRDFRFKRAAEIRKSMEKFVKNIHTNAKLVSYEFKNLNSVDKPVSLKVKLFVKDFALKTGDKLFMFKLPFGFSAYYVGEEKRYNDFYLCYNPNEEKFNIKIKIPEGFKLYYSLEDKNINFKNIWSLKATSNENNGVYTFGYDYKEMKTIIPKKYYKKYKKIMETLANWSDKYVILERK